MHVACIEESQLFTVSQEKWLPAKLGAEGQIKKSDVACNMWLGMGYFELGLG